MASPHLRILSLIALIQTGPIPAQMLADRESPPQLAQAAPPLGIRFPAEQSLIQFFYAPQLDEEPNVEIYLTHYLDQGIQTVHLETLEPEGQPAEIGSVFTLDADGDNERELFIISTWPVRHTAIGTEGTYYRVYVYRKAAGEGDELLFPRAHDIEDRLGAGRDGKREGERVSFPFKDFESIRDELAR